MERLFVKCKTCGEWFNSGFTVSSAEQAKSNALLNNGAVCPKGHKNLYSGVDYALESALKRR
jgi:hypothetical protein